MTVNPILSIITVVFNNESTIEATILSVLSQDFKEYEYIIIDGGSTDGTIEIIKKYQDRITLWITEPDKGIYDAMNKGLNFVNGKWCYFLNSGDSFYSTNTLNKVRPKLSYIYDVIYGSINCITKTDSFEIKPKPIERILNEMVFCHQAVFIKKDIIKKFKFNTNYKIAADFDLFRNLYLNKFKFLQIDTLVVNYEAENGISSNNFYSMLMEYAIIKGNWTSFKGKLHVFYKSILFIIFKFLRNLVPVKLRLFLKNLNSFN